MHVGFLWNSRFASQNYHNGRILSILEHHPSLQAVPDGAWAACFGCSRSCATASWGPEAVPRIGWVPLWTSCERTCCKRMQQDCASYHNIYLQISTNKGHGPPRSQIVACGSYFSIYIIYFYLVSVKGNCEFCAQQASRSIASGAGSFALGTSADPKLYCIHQRKVRNDKGGQEHPSVFLSE